MRKDINKMTIIITLRDICMFISAIILLYVMYEFFNKVIFPWIVDVRTKDIEKNPNWIMQKLKENYYGFEDIDIVIVNSPLGMVPRFRTDKKQNNKLQLLIPEDISTEDIGDISRLALAGKIKIKYGLWYPDKPTYWLSILNYILDGGNINIEAAKFEKIHKVK